MIMVGDDYIYVGTILGIRSCKDRRKNDFPEENSRKIDEPSQGDWRITPQDDMVPVRTVDR